MGFSLEPTGKFSRELRVRKKPEYDRIHRHGKRAHSQHLTVVASENDRGHPRLGCAIGRKVGPAVVRNRIRRMLKECFRRGQTRLPSFDFVVIVRPSGRELASCELDRLAGILGPLMLEAAQKSASSGGRARC